MTISVWQFQECDFVAAESLEAAQEWYRRVITDEDVDEVRPVSVGQLMCTGESEDDPDGEMITFAEAIARHQAEGRTFPTILASIDQ